MLRKETVEANTLELLIRLQSESFLSNFVLVGETALSLQIGHRKSIDLDFFTIVDFESSFLINQLLENYNLIVRNQTAQSLVGVIDGVKVDFIRFRYPFGKPIVEIEGVRMLSVEDIAPMKLDAVSGRVKKKDFYDLYFLLQKFNLREILNLYSEKFKHQTDFHVIKSLSYFEDAESEPDPIVFEEGLSWEKVKKTILYALENLK
jgi:predicted nucleotidyltransferase component of viral defense system